MFDPFNVEHVARLNSATDASIAKLGKYRKNYERLRLKLHDPCHADKPPTIAREPVNEISDFVFDFTRLVVSQNPSLRIGRTSAPRVSGMTKAWLEDWGRKTNVAAVLGGAFQECLLRWGIAYLSVEASRERGLWPRWTVLDFHDWFIDQRQADEAEIDFEGHDYDVLREELDNTALYDADAVSALNSITPKDGSYVSMYDRVRLRIEWLPRERLLLTLPAESGDRTKPLNVRKFFGPPEGPYAHLSLKKRRGTIVPVSLCAALEDLSDLRGLLERQKMMQADQWCEFHVAERGSARDADLYRTAEHGKVYTVENVNGVKKETRGGVAQQTMLGSMQASDLFNEKTGNLRQATGRGVGAPTLGQERSLGVGVASMIDNAKTALNRFAKTIYDRTAWYFLHDDVYDDSEKPRMITYTDEYGDTAPGEWNPRMAGLATDDDLNFEIIPDTLIERSAAEQASSLLASVQALASLMVLPGPKPSYFDMPYMVEVMADNLNQPELGKLFGQAQTAESVVPGADGAAVFAQRNGSPQMPGRTGPSPAQRMQDKLMFQTNGSTEAERS
jgi:hypothetical protein